MSDYRILICHGDQAPDPCDILKLLFPNVNFLDSWIQSRLQSSTCAFLEHAFSTGRNVCLGEESKRSLAIAVVCGLSKCHSAHLGIKYPSN